MLFSQDLVRKLNDFLTFCKFTHSHLSHLHVTSETKAYYPKYYTQKVKKKEHWSPRCSWKSNLIAMILLCI